MSVSNNQPMIDISSLNQILNKSQSSNTYQVVKFLGNEKNTDNYLLNDVAGKHYICKTRPMESPYKEQTEFELSLYDYLAKKKNIQKYINPSIWNTRDQKFIYSIFPVIQGISLSKLDDHLKKLSVSDQQVITSYIIKKLLEAIGNIHQLQIAHNSIDDKNIIVDVGNSSKINVKLTNFNMGCGKYLKNVPSNMNTINDNELKEYMVKDCLSSQELRSKLSDDHLNVDSDFQQRINYAKKWDLWCMGLICLKLMLGNHALPWNEMMQTFDKNNRQPDKLNQMYLESIYNYVKKIKNKDVKNYVFLITKNLLDDQFEKNKNPARYALEKIIIYEKYK